MNRTTAQIANRHHKEQAAKKDHKIWILETALTEVRRALANVKKERAQLKKRLWDLGEEA